MVELCHGGCKVRVSIVNLSHKSTELTTAVLHGIARSRRIGIRFFQGRRRLHTSISNSGKTLVQELVSRHLKITLMGVNLVL